MPGWKKPGHRRRDGPLDLAARLRSTVGMMVAGYRHPQLCGGMHARKIRATVLAAVEAAITSILEPETKIEEEVGTREPEGILATVSIDAVFRSAAREWGEMDEMKAERFYEIVEGCLDAWIDLPDIGESTEASRRIIAGIN